MLQYVLVFRFDSHILLHCSTSKSLFKDFLEVFEHLITEQITVMNGSKFRNECCDCILFWLILYVSSISVIEIGSDKV